MRAHDQAVGSACNLACDQRPAYAHSARPDQQQRLHSYRRGGLTHAAEPVQGIVRSRCGRKVRERGRTEEEEVHDEAGLSREAAGAKDKERERERETSEGAY